MSCSVSQSMIRSLSIPTKKKYSLVFDATRTTATRSRATAAVATSHSNVYHDTFSNFRTCTAPLKTSIQFHRPGCYDANLISRKTLSNFSTQTNPAYQSTKSHSEADLKDASTPVTIKSIKRSPSVLTQLPSNYTPKQAWKLLRSHLAGKRQVRLDDLVSICHAARPNTVEDAKIIRTALFELNRFNHLRITVDAAKDAVEGMKRSAMGEGAECQLKVGNFVANAFVKEELGLYVAVESQVLNENVFQVLLDAIHQYQSDALNGEEQQDDKMEKLVNDSAVVAKKVIDTLLTRASNPTKDMKKRKKRKYLKYLRCSGGPTPESIDFAIKICLSHANQEQGVAMAREILDSFKELPFLGTAKPETIGLLEEHEMKMKMQSVKEDENKQDGSS